MADLLHGYRRQLSLRLTQGGGAGVDPGIEALARALLASGDEAAGRADCDRCQALLPAYVEAEVGGSLDRADNEMRLAGYHLLLCPECGRLHARLLQITWLLARDELPRPPRRPAPPLPQGGSST